MGIFVDDGDGAGGGVSGGAGVAGGASSGYRGYQGYLHFNNGSGQSGGGNWVRDFCGRFSPFSHLFGCLERIPPAEKCPHV